MKEGVGRNRGCSSTTDVGRLAPAPAEEVAQSEVSEWELRERREREEERRVEAEELGAEGERKSSTSWLHLVSVRRSRILNQ